VLVGGVAELLHRLRGVGLERGFERRVVELVLAEVVEDLALAHGVILEAASSFHHNGKGPQRRAASAAAEDAEAVPLGARVALLRKALPIEVALF